MIRVCHVTSAHGVEDDRIFLKECVSLAANGYDVYLVERGDTYEKDGVHVIGLGNISDSRLKRMINGGRRAYRAALRIDADIYQLHDPELLPYAVRLKRRNKTVIFDSHEDVPAQIIDKAWIPGPLRKIIAKLYQAYETHVVGMIDAVITATPHIADVFSSRAKKVVNINNYPKLDDIQFQEKPFMERERIVCYAGGLDELRGESIMVEAMSSGDDILMIAGDHQIQEIRKDETDE